MENKGQNLLRFSILGIPQPKQSARFRAVKMSEKTFVKSYQKKEVIENERNIKFDVKSQLPQGFVPFNSALSVKVLFVFPPLSSWSKKKMAEFDNGAIFYKDTKPDLTDNLMKGLFDAMNGLVYTDDSRIVKVFSSKIYGKVPRIDVEFKEL